ncbi:hypothetical protein ARD30_17220 [Bosea thiooxidans]|uniref:Uncharacterized protein involved in exopolysaccharide biosynthesis n=1 Tax=Bosea thiooxidans TaxID=53254 RepID=A0A0Q3I3H9_9HYPH|nr:exopolysaccharide transport family protein [Bosea thiooxidans]KQK29503.1 hypothetical protein ARD30_17220 [Bosea thiooxidans]SKC15423.1 Uncharacterized protein involved in exopolysaccharide biosynthesis [Bosea thiooxidans]
MFTTEPAASEGEAAPERADRPAAPAPAGFARLADPAWVVATLWGRRGLILLMALAGFCLALLASLFIAPKYVSTAQLFIDPRDLRVLQNDVSPNTVGSDPTSITSYLESQARVIASDSIKTRVVERLDLDKDPDFGGASRGGLLSFLSGSDATGTSAKAMAYALVALDRNVRVHRGERTFVIDITATAQDPGKAARIANALAEAYLEDQTAVRAEAAQRATAALTGRLEELRNRLRLAEEKAQKYREANNIVGISGKSLGEEQLALNAAQLVAARTRATEAKAKLDQIAATRASSIEAGAIPEAVASNTMTALRAQLGAALAKEADLVASLGARHPALTAAQSQVRDARRQITEELGRIARSAKAEYDRANEAERQLARRVDQLTAAQHAEGRASVQLRELEREVESSRAVYDAFLRRARETGELGGIDTTNARIISPAMPPLEKSGVSWRALALLGGFGGAAAGAALALGLALFPIPLRPTGAATMLARRPFWRRAPQPAPEAETATAQPPALPLAVAPVEPPVPPTPPVEKGGSRGWRRLVAIPGGQAPRAAEAAPAVSVPLLGSVPAVRHRRWRREIADARSVFQSKAHLVDVIDKPQSGFARAVAEIRSELAGVAQGETRRRILVLGQRPQSGATTLALNLALDAARSGLPALLVDAGDGTLGLTRVFASEAPAGLGEVLGGTLSLARAVLKDEGTGLAFLPRTSGEASADSAIQAALFAGPRRFGPVIVDGGSLPPNGLTRHFAEAVDDIVLVVGEARRGKADLERLQAELGPHAAKLRGLVVNAS